MTRYLALGRAYSGEHLALGRAYSGDSSTGQGTTLAGQVTSAGQGTTLVGQVISAGQGTTLAGLVSCAGQGTTLAGQVISAGQGTTLGCSFPRRGPPLYEESGHCVLSCQNTLETSLSEGCFPRGGVHSLDKFFAQHAFLLLA